MLKLITTSPYKGLCSAIANAVKKWGSVVGLFSLLLVTSPYAQAGLLKFFKDEEGDTKWQYVANFSSGVLIILLSLTVLTLFNSRRHLHKANRDLENIRNALEQRVKERTATLDEYNTMLKETNSLLEGEIAEHKETTSRLESSETYIKNILESMPLILIGLDEDKKITQWNKWAEQITGLDSNRAIGKNLWDAYPSITITPDQVGRVIAQDKPTTIKHSQRGQYYFDITVYPLSGQSEKGVVILIDNVTQRKLTENMLIQRDKMSSMGELAANMAHDINIPMQAIMKDVDAVNVALGTLTDKLSKPNNIAELNDIRSSLDDAAEKGKQTLATITNLLDFSRAHGEKQRKENIPELIAHTISLANDVLSEPEGLKFTDIEIEHQIQDDLPAVPCFAAELQQVFLSLFRHSCYSLNRIEKENIQRENHTPRIKIELSYYYQALWIKVQHNGVGLTIEEQQSIFEPFFINTAGNDQYEAGQGLSFSNFIVTEHHKGQMAVTSDVDIGTTFHIQLQPEEH